MAEDETKPLEIVSLTIPAQNPLACSMCGKIFSSRRELLVHQWSHRERQTFYCPNCDKNFNNENQFKRHMHVHNKEGKKYVTCDICKKVFRNHRVLEEHHVQDHTGQKPYKCGTCGIQFSWHENLKKHLHTHIEKPHACMICHESFRDAAGLAIHNKIHKKEMKEQEKREQERREQEEREKRRELYKSMGALSTPLLPDINVVKEEAADDEEEDRVFKCRVCNQSFKYSFTLEAHMKGHEEDGLEMKQEAGVKLEVQPVQKPVSQNPVFEKPHECHICKQSFRWAFCLDAHLKIHEQGFDAKVEKEKERRIQRKAKERRRLANKQKSKNASNGEEVQEGTVVIVVEDLAKCQGKEAKNVSDQAGVEEAMDTSSADQAEEEKEGGEETDTVTQRKGKKRRGDVQISDSIVVKSLKVNQETQVDSDRPEHSHEGQGEPQPDVPMEVSPSQPSRKKSSRGRGRARQRGGKSNVNHIDLNEVVASIRKEQEKCLFMRGGCRQRGGMAIRGGPLPQRRVTRSSLRNIMSQEQEHGDDSEDPHDHDGDENSGEWEGNEQLDDESLNEGESEISGHSPQNETNNVRSDAEDDDGEDSVSADDESTSDESSHQGEQDDDQQSEAGSDEETFDEGDEEGEHTAGQDDQNSQSQVTKSQQYVQTEELYQEEEECRLKDAAVQAVRETPSESEDDSGDEGNVSDRDNNSSEQSESDDVENGQEEEEVGEVDPETDGEESEDGNREAESGSDLSNDTATEGEERETCGSDNGQPESEYDEGDLRSLEVKDETVQEAEEEDGSMEEDDANNNDCASSDGSVLSDSTDNDRSDNGKCRSSAGSADSDASLEDDDHDPLQLKMKVYSCELCSKAFVQRSSLLAHKIDHHKENGNSSQSDSSVEPHQKVTLVTRKRGRRAKCADT